jgi:hypothetical protein
MEGKIESRFHIELGDGTAMNFRDKEFDVVHSNSVIEHLTDWEHQKAFASEIRRVGKKIWVQTPARYFPVEPHYIDFICHWFPKSIQRKLIRNFSFWGLLTRPSQEDIDFCVNSIRLLSRAEFQELFPDCRIQVERVLGWPKSYIAIRS